MGFDLDDLTWTCHVCGEERPDRLISVHKSYWRRGGLDIQENIRYCNDRPDCAAAAPFKTFMRNEEIRVSNGKYVTFKADEFGKWAGGDRHAQPLPTPVPDAVVIRLQDVFAGPALQAYAASISVATKILQNGGEEVQAKGLQKIADYFHEQAEIALDTNGKLPD